MSSEKPITRENLNEYLKELAKEFRRLNGTKTPAEVILIGGAANRLRSPLLKKRLKSCIIM
jgi:hypothetical protein